ncbi:MAG: tryptophan 7-halogenase [Deltaproteobacteria bacterium]|nr:tryptophan 7-halogenase [Deltaproteobacteria bacterium]
MVAWPIRWDEEVEVVVVGGGPGGSTVSGLLAASGRKVLVLERERLPRFHIGESLLPSSTPVLRALGLHDALDAVFIRKYGARFLDDGLGVHAPGSTAKYLFSEAFPPSIPYAWEVTRAEFDELLLRNASRLGAEVREGWRVRGPVRDEKGYVVGVEAQAPDGATRRIGARVVVDATGREALFARARRDKARVHALDKTAIFTQIRGGRRNEGIDAGQIEITILSSSQGASSQGASSQGSGMNPDGTTPGWAWFIPFKDGRTSIGFVLSTALVDSWMKGSDDLFDREAMGLPTEYRERPADARERLERLFDGCMQRSPWMQHFVGDAPKIEPVRAAADFSFRVEELAGDGWLTVGDSGGFLDPLFSTGAHMAMGGGQRAAGAIDAALRAGDVSAAAFAQYARDIRRAGDLFLGAVQSFYRGELRGLLFHPEQRPALRKTITSMLAGDVFHDEETASLWVGYFREHFPARV